MGSSSKSGAPRFFRLEISTAGGPATQGNGRKGAQEAQEHPIVASRIGVLRQFGLQREISARMHDLRTCSLERIRFPSPPHTYPCAILRNTGSRLRVTTFTPSTPMKTILPCLAALVMSTASLSAAPSVRVLYFTKSSGYEHSVVKWTDGQPGSSYSEKILTALAPKHDFTLTFSKDGSLFSADYLAGFDVVMFYTSGDLLSVGTDGHPAMTAAGKQALLDWVHAGHGFIAIHAGSDTFHTGESGGGNPSERANRYQLHGAASDPYVLMLGGEFIKHGPQQVATVSVVDPKFPGCAALGDTFSCMEEWYSLKEFASNLHALLVLQTKGMEGSEYQRPPYPLAWARSYGSGRVWNNAMGHREDVWDSERFQAMLVGGIAWAGGRIPADVTPNLDRVAPRANTLPPPPSK